LEEQKRSIILLLPFVGSLLILLNIFTTALIGTPVMIFSSSPDSVEALTKNLSPMWGRIAFGFSNYAEGNLPAIGIVLAAVILYFSLTLYLRPRYERFLSFIIMVFSFVSLFYGGGFLIGSILAFIGGALAFQTPMKIENSLIGKLLLSLRASRKFFQRLAEEAAVKEAAMVILFVNLLSGIGNALYMFNANGLINNLSSESAFETLLNGRINMDIALVPAPITMMGLGIIKWMVLSILIFVIGVKFFDAASSLGRIATVAGFAYAPISLQIFTPFVFTSSPFLLIWPMAVFIVTNLWMAIVLVIGLQQILRVSFTKSLALVALCGAIYELIDTTIFLPMVNQYIPKFQIQPNDVMLLIVSAFIIVGLFFIGSKERS